MRKEKKLNWYSWCIILLGTVIIGYALSSIDIHLMKMWAELLIFAVLVTITESLSIEVEDGSAVSTSFAINFCAILVFTPSFAVVIAYFGKLFSCYVKENKVYHILNTSFYKRLFNTSVSAISVFLAAWLYQSMLTHLTQFEIVGINLLGAVTAVLLYTIVNVLSYSILFSILEDKRIREIFSNFGWIIRNFNALAPFGVLMALSYQTWNVLVVLLFLGPFLLARYTYSMYVDMKHLYYKTINTLTHAIDAKDQYTNGHSYRVADYAEKTARKLSMSLKQIELVKNSAILHDIGKIGISDVIINKPGHLDIDEREEVQKHPVIGEKIIKEIDAFHEVSRVIRHHHERFDGGGYPDGLKASKIPFESAIIAVVDSYDAMTSDRSYRKALSHEDAIYIIKEERGKQFHPDVVDAFISVVEANGC